MKKYLAIAFMALMVLTLTACRHEEPQEITRPTEVIVLPLPTVEPTTIPTEPETDPTETTEEETEPETEATIPETTEKEVGEPGKIVGANFVNVREKPGVTSDRVTRLAYGTKVMVYETVTHDNAIWGRIDEGWVSMEYVLLDSVANSYYYNHGPKPTTEPTEAETAPTETGDSQPEESKPGEGKPEESKPDESKPEESKPTESKPEESKPAESKPEESKPTESKPEDPKAE